MKVEFDVKAFTVFSKIHPSCFAFLIIETVRTNNMEAFDSLMGPISVESRLPFLKSLEDLGFIKILDIPESINESYFRYLDVREEFLKLFPNKKNITASEWIEEWRNIFPQKVKSGGYPVRGDKEGCLSKMNTFINKYKYPKDVIFEATKLYVEKKENERWAYMQLAHYFILKNGTSTLAALCEEVVRKRSSNKPEEADYESTITI